MGVNNLSKNEIQKIELEKDMMEVENEIYTGIGIKKMKAYKCNLSLNDLIKKREKFWKIKTNPKTVNWTNWIIIKQAISYDEHRASLLLEQYDILPLNGCINFLIDKDGNEYKIPNYCINDPYFERKIEKKGNIKELFIKIRFYTYGGDPPLTLEVSNKITGKDLKEKYRSHCNINEKKNIRMFLSGIEIQNNQYLYQHNINEEKPIYVIIN